MQISGRMAAREQDLTDRMKEQFAIEKAAANAKVQAELEQTRKDPARVVAVVEILRRHIIQMHGLRISNEEREQKTAAVYEFITSDRYKTLLDQIETHTVSLLDLDVKEEKAHKNTWASRGKLILDIQKVRGNLSFEVERIIGTAETRD